jgi:hypothetical protein
LRDVPQEIAAARAQAIVVNLKHQMISYFNVAAKPVAETW